MVVNPGVFTGLIIMVMAVSGAFCTYSVAQFMGLEYSPVVFVLSMGIIGGVYSLNRYTDIREDFFNARFHKGMLGARYLGLGVGLLLSAFMFFVVTGRLTAFVMGFFFICVAYSIPCIPWYRRGLVLLKIKQIPFIKNLAVAVCWSSAIFMMPVIYDRVEVSLTGVQWYVFVGLLLNVLSNTTYSDVRDRSGDEMAGTRTLPVIMGEVPVVVGLIFLNLAWMGLVWYGVSDPSLRGLLIFVAGYEVAYIMAHTLKTISKDMTELVAELGFFIFGAGLWVVSKGIISVG